jgi:hypothetical protein
MNTGKMHGIASGEDDDGADIDVSSERIVCRENRPA